MSIHLQAWCEWLAHGLAAHNPVAIFVAVALAWMGWRIVKAVFGAPMRRPRAVRYDPHMAHQLDTTRMDLHRAERELRELREKPDGASAEPQAKAPGTNPYQVHAPQGGADWPQYPISPMPAPSIRLEPGPCRHDQIVPVIGKDGDVLRFACKNFRCPAVWPPDAMMYEPESDS